MDGPVGFEGLLLTWSGFWVPRRSEDFRGAVERLLTPADPRGLQIPASELSEAQSEKTRRVQTGQEPRSTGSTWKEGLATVGLGQGAVGHVILKGHL